MRGTRVTHWTAVAGRLLVGLLVGGVLLAGPSSFGRPPGTNPRCIQVGGTIMTNFTSPTTTLGSATGDLRGAVAATILSLTPGQGGATTFRVQHQWTTDAGETLFFEPADAVGVPTQSPGVFGVTYDELRLVGGTGRYDGATGSLRVFGAADLQGGETVFRYEGEICFQSAVRP